MTKPMFYQPARAGRTVIAFAAALAIHLGALVLAGMQQHQPVSGPVPGHEDFPWVDLEPSPPDEEQTPVEPAPTPPPTDETFIPEDRPTPVPVRPQNNQPAPPLQRTRTNRITGGQPHPSARLLAVNAPRPEYPYEARRQRITGDGIVAMTVDSQSGSVAGVTMLKSTGSAVLDNAALSGFRRWKFKPGTPSQVKVPITFTMTGAQY